MADRSSIALHHEMAQALGALRALRHARELVAASYERDEALSLLDALIDGAAIRLPLATRAAEDAVLDEAADALALTARHAP